MERSIRIVEPDVVNGDAKSRGKWFGRMIGEVALAAVVTKGVDKVGKLAKGSKIIQEAGGVIVLPEVMKGRILGKEKNIKPPSIDKPDEIIKQRVHENVGKSKAARKSSNFDEYLTKEKELLKEVEKKRDLKGKEDLRQISSGGLRNELALTDLQKSELLDYAKGLGFPEENIVFKDVWNS